VFDVDSSTFTEKGDTEGADIDFVLMAELFGKVETDGEGVVVTGF
jgi:hypothetical protein